MARIDTCLLGPKKQTPPRHINCGSAYVFRLEYGAWHQEAQLLPGSVSRGAHFGQAVQARRANRTHEFSHVLVVRRPTPRNVIFVAFIAVVQVVRVFYPLYSLKDSNSCSMMRRFVGATDRKTPEAHGSSLLWVARVCSRPSAEHS